MLKKFIVLVFCCSFFLALNCAVERNIAKNMDPAESAVEMALKNLEFKTDVEILDEDIDILIDEKASWQDRLNIFYKYIKVRSLEHWEKHQDKYIYSGVTAGVLVSVVAIVLLCKKCLS
ncbi:MAG: hypothetical protein ABIA74_05450 [bacterium]